MSSELLQFAVVGAIVSLVVQGLKKLAGTTGLGTTLIAVAFSLIAGSLYYQFQDNVAVMDAVVSILVFANAVYGFILSRFE